MESESLLSQMRRQQMRKRQFYEVEAESHDEEAYSNSILKKWIQEKPKDDDS